MKTLFTCLLCLTLGSALGQHHLRGKVVDDNGVALAYAEIYDSTTGKSALADDRGDFRLDDLQMGSHRLFVFRHGFVTHVMSLQIPMDSLISIRLNPLAIDLSAVEVAAHREEVFALRQLKDVEGTSIYAGKRTEVVVLDKVLGNLATNNARQVYAQVAGLNIYEGSEGGLQLGIGGRGLDPNRTANFNTRQNGYDISADVLGYPENYYTPPTEAVAEIQVVRGASSLQYGTQFGGLINFKLRRIAPFENWKVRSRQTFGSFGLFNTYNAIAYHKNKFTAEGYINHKRGKGYREASDYNASNVHLSLAYAFSNRTSARLEMTYFNYLAQQAGGLTDAQFVANPRQSTRARNWFGVDWKLFSIKVNHKMESDGELSMHLFGLDADRKSVGFRGTPGMLNENPILAIDEEAADGSFRTPRDLIFGSFRNIGMETKYLHRYALLGRRAIALLGVKYYRANNLAEQGPGSLGTDADFSFYHARFPDYPSQSSFVLPNRNLAIFGEQVLYLKEGLSLTPGFRYEYIRTGSDGDYRKVVFDNAGNPISNIPLSDNQELERGLFLMGLGLEWKKSDRWQWTANISQNYRSVTFSDIRVVNPSFVIDPNIRDERGFTADLGLQGRLGKVLSCTLGAYALVYRDRIGIVLDDRANRVRKNVGDAVISGLEVLCDINVDKWFVQAGAIPKWTCGFFINAAATHSRYVRSEERNVVNNKVEFIPALNLKTGMRAGWKNVGLQLQWGIISKQFTDAQNSRIAQAGDFRAGLVGEIPSYQVADLAAFCNLKPFRIEAGINNLSNQSYFTRRATGYPGPGIIPSDGRSFYVTLQYDLTVR